VQRAYRARLAAAGKVVRLIDAGAAAPHVLVQGLRGIYPHAQFAVSLAHQNDLRE
jgi:hypothetical protein